MLHNLLAWHPPVGVWIGVLGLAGIIVPLVRDPKEMGKWEKASWTFVLFALLLLEMKAVYQDRNEHDREQAEARAEQLKHFGEIAKGIAENLQAGERAFKATTEQSQDQFSATLKAEKNNLTETLAGLKETVRAATGGDGFCYALFVPPDYAGNSTAISSIVPQGKYPLTNVNALVIDDDMMVEHLNQMSKTGKTDSADDFANIMQRAQEWIHIGDLPPQFPEQFSMRAASSPLSDRRMLTITFWANNGSWTEKFALRRVNGKWLRLIRVWRQTLDKKKKAMVADVLFQQIDDGFPEDKNTKASSVLTASPSN